MSKRILIVEDEKALARFLQLELEHEGFHVKVVHDGASGLRLALEQTFDLILLDLMLPELSGLEVCRKLRQTKDTPILMLTARTAVKDRVVGLDCGADDYISKPFAIEEILARIRSLRRRVTHHDPVIFQLHDLSLALETRQVTRAGETIELSTREFELLHYLLKNKSIVVTRETLLQKVWGYQFTGETNVVDVYIRYLRAKIDDHHKIKLIHTVRGFGYVLRGRG